MIGRREIAFSSSLIEKAEARAAYQLKIVDSLLPETNYRLVDARRQLLHLMEERTALLKDRHRKLLTKAAAQEMLDEQTKFVATLIVGDARKPEARRRLDQMHEDASAGVSTEHDRPASPHAAI